jgi:hypothetical protein
VANGRKRKTTIFCLDGENGNIHAEGELETHIYYFYKNLFRKEQRGRRRLYDNTWSDQHRVVPTDNSLITRPFSWEEIDGVIKELNSTALDPDGFIVIFLKKCWGTIKFEVKAILDYFYLGKRELGRIKSGVLSLIPKVKGTTSLKQFKPCAIFNMILRAVTKVFCFKTGSCCSLYYQSLSNFLQGEENL